MILKRNLLISSVCLLGVFVITTYYLFTKLIASEYGVVKIQLGIQQQIYQQLHNLPEVYKQKSEESTDRIDKIIKNLNTNKKITDFVELWKVANSWVSETQIVDHESEHLGPLLQALKTAKIIKADLEWRGSQLKFRLTLEGNQTVIFKPQWYEKERIIEGPIYAGKDRYGSEIVAFYLSILLNLPWTPPSVERVLSITKDILPVGTRRLINTSFEYDNRHCIYGDCIYCKREKPICEDSTLSLRGAVIFNLNAVLKVHRSPWQRTYKKNKKASWEKDDGFCRILRKIESKKRLLDLIDASIFDFLIQNGDRHHYETLNDSVILLDNGKGFGNPNIQHLDVLAPLYQCCTLRTSTMKSLQSLSGGVLRMKLIAMPNIKNFLTTYHLEALEERLLMVFATVEYCRSRNKAEY